METLVKDKKITLATFKAFIKRNEGNLFILNNSDFDGMTDCVIPCNGLPRRAEANDSPNEYSLPNTLGIKGVWLVGSSRDYFKHYEEKMFSGISVSNCCGSF